ncbi:MAG TPA: HEAT repeat domain-containing protein [Candidatus Acidoferrum sp.]|jgi:HEAT repeat protein
MMRGIFLLGAGIVAAGMLAGAASRGQAQERESAVPRVNSVQMETRALNGSLGDEVKKWEEQAAQAQWLGYSIPAVAESRVGCCGDYDNGRNGAGGHCGNYRLEGRGDGSSINTGDGTVKLEAPRNLRILLRAENRQIGKVRVVDEDCALDSGGLRFVWLTGVKPPESVALLEGFVLSSDFEQRKTDRFGNGALTAIALHADSSADRALESFTSPDRPAALRRQTTFWLGAARGGAGFAVLKKLEKSETSQEVRPQLPFAFSVSHEPEAVTEMIRMAKNDESAHTRGQALFWLAQKAGQKAAGAITDAIENDPDTSVKKQAVFALSQLPKDEGVPKLIEVAQNNHNLAVRKQAMFWLGQSNDPRALQFFEKVLTQ